jgi:hypothetical protein
MKNWTFVAIIAIFGIIMGFVACDNGNEATHTHEWGKWTQSKAPTITEDGMETKTCSTCGEKETRKGADALAKPFFYTWSRDEWATDSFLIISASFIRNDDLEIKNPVWAEATNTDVSTKAQYPSGFSLRGSWIWDDDPSIIDEEVEFSLFINASKNKILWSNTYWSKVE